jgi:hypothetical protein
MDLFAAQKLNSKLCLRAKLGAWVCFLAACGLLSASLLFAQPGEEGNGRGLVASTMLPTR